MIRKIKEGMISDTQTPFKNLFYENREKTEMKYKASLSVILTAILLFTLTACGKTQSPAATTESTTATVQTEQPTVPETTVKETIPANWEEASEDEAWQEKLSQSLFDNYGVLPEYYENLGNGIYQVYVEVGGEIVPFVTVNSATGDYHG